jgi:hypothetical protein
MKDNLRYDISDCFNHRESNDADSAYTRLVKLLSPDILTFEEVEELIDRIESFTEQEIQEIIDER